MGGSNYSDDDYQARRVFRASHSIPTFKHDVDVRTGAAVACHPKMDIKGVKLRECRDSDSHPNSRAIAVLLDVTGSMNAVPRQIQEKLPTLMGLLLRKGLVDPAILVGAIGDAYSDRAPLQIGQFESGMEIDDDITNLYLEGGGGGTKHETYELGMYFLARHTSLDCYEKRGLKGYLFIVGDEMYYPKVDQSRVERFIGDSIESFPTADLFAELQKTYEVFFILPKMTSYFDHDDVAKAWKDHLGERFLKLDDPSAICELIASTIAVNEGEDLDAVKGDLHAAGTTDVAANSVERALTPYSQKSGGKATSITVGSSGAPSGLATV